MVLGEVLGGFLRPDRFPDCTTVEAQGLPRGVRGARGSKKGRRCGPRGIQAKHRKNLHVGFFVFFIYPPYEGGIQVVSKILENSSKIEAEGSKNQ